MRTLRNALILACVIAALPLWWRAEDVFAEVKLERRAAGLYSQGVTLHLKGRSAEAAHLLRQAIILAPFAVEAYGALADAEFRQGRLNEAIATYRRLLEIYPYMYYGGLYREVGMIELRAGRNAEALDDLTRAVTLDPSDWHALYLLGHAQLRLGERAGAHRAWRRVLELRPDFAPAYEQIRLLGD